METLVCWMEELEDTITMPILTKHTKGSEILTKLKEDIQKGWL